MHVIAYDPYLTAHEIKRRGAVKVAWQTLLRQSDAISLHAPLTVETKKLFNQTAFARIKPSALVVNTARGMIIDEKALLNALRLGKIRSAALDVYPEEPLPSKHPLRAYARLHNNLILTPHLGATTEEAIQNASMAIASAVVQFLKEKRR
jgi:phosphoglycerate dehydrogenase-like enzyme